MSTFAKVPDQTVWSRRKNQAATDEGPNARKGYYTLVIHPGARTLRIGRACDIMPVVVSHAIARRKRKVPPAAAAGTKQTNGDDAMDVDAPEVKSERARPPAPPLQTVAHHPGIVSDPNRFKDAVDAIGHALRERMKFYKLHYSHAAAGQCTSYNGDPTNRPEIIHDHNDPHHVQWMTARDPDVVVGDDVWRAGDPDEWVVRWPLARGFNAPAYPSGSLNEALSDIETIWEQVLKSRLDIDRKDFGVCQPLTCQTSY